MSSISAGTTSTTTLVHSGDTTGSLVFKTNDTGSGGTTAVTLDTSQNATFAGKVTSAGALTLASNGTTTAVTIDTSQNVGIGNSSPFAVGGSWKMLNVGIGGIQGGIAATNSTLLVQNSYYNGSSWQRATTGSTGTIEVGGGAIIFSNDASGSAGTFTPTERMRIDSSGKVLIGTTATDNPAGGFVLYVANQNSQLMIGHESGTPSGYTYAKFCYNSSNIGNITQNGTTGVLYNLTSDYRLKNNPIALTGAKDFVMALQPKTWDWWDGSGKGVGFIAHEFMEVAKYSGHGEKDAVDENGNPIHQSIQPSSSEVMANIVALLQEQQALITAQAETINALTARIVALEGQ